MADHDLWNHVNFSIPPENLQPLEECFRELMPWDLFVKRDDMLGYRFATMVEKGMAFFQPSEPAGLFAKTIARVRRSSPDLDAALLGLEHLRADQNDHTGFIVKSVDEWEARLAKFHQAQDERPEWQVKVVEVLRPTDKHALTDRIYQAWVRIGLLGPLRNTFEMQCLNPATVPEAERAAL